MDDLKPGQVYLVTYRLDWKRPTSKPTTRKLRLGSTHGLGHPRTHGPYLRFDSLRRGVKPLYLAQDEVIVMTEVTK